MAVLLVLGMAILLTGIAMDEAHVMSFLILNVTSKPLGSLAAGYASTVRGYRVYSGLVRSFGLVILGLWVASFFPPGALLFVLGLAAFAYYTIRAVRGEVRTYRALKR